MFIFVFFARRDLITFTCRLFFLFFYFWYRNLILKIKNNTLCKKNIYLSYIVMYRVFTI